VGHLNELQEKYGSQGLTVISITNEPRGLVDKYVEETGATHPVVIESTDSSSSWGITGFPSSFLVGPDGKIAYAGHPSSVTNDMIEELLKDARLFPEVPKSLKGVVKKLEKDDFKSAISMLDKFLAKETISDEEKASATELKEWIDWRHTSAMEGAAASIEKGDYYRAAKAYEDLAKVFKGTDIGSQADDALKELLSDKDRKREVSAGEQLAKAKAKAADMSAKKAVKLFESLAKKYDGTVAGEEARRLAVRYANQR
jgi:hypothetical protein